MTNPTDNIKITSSTPDVKGQSRKGLQEFFRQKSVKNLVSVLVPSALAAVMFPVFGPAVAGAAAAVAVHNGLQLLGISFSTESVNKLLKPLEGKQIDESDMQAVLEEILPQDKQVNDDAAKALVAVLPEVKEAALTNSKLDLEWLGKSLEVSLQQQGETMAKIAPQVHELVQLNGMALEEKIQFLLANWSSNIQEITAKGHSSVTGSEQGIEGKGGTNRQTISAEDNSEISQSKQNIKLT